MNRFSVLYILKQQYSQFDCATLTEAKDILQQISAKKDYMAIGIYDAKTELFSWEPTRQDQYNQAGIEEQGKLGDQIISIAQALRYRDLEWQRAGTPRRLSFFA